VAQVIRDRFFDGYREAEFLVVCDVKKENSQVIQELNDAQVILVILSTFYQTMDYACNNMGILFLQVLTLILSQALLMSTLSFRRNNARNLRLHLILFFNILIIYFLEINFFNFAISKITGSVKESYCCDGKQKIIYSN
jgi:hypothetical protein